MTRCLVFGQSGQVARAIAQLSTKFSKLEIVQVGRDQADFTNPESVAQQVRTHRPAVVINAAAYTKVDQAESDEANAHLVNAVSPGKIAAACAEVDAAMIHISTDYVFAGDAAQPYGEDAPIAPTGAYGRTKAAGEQLVRDALPRHLILRTAWVFSASGQNFVKTMLRLNRDVIRVVDDQRGNPTPALAIAETVLTMAHRIVSGTPGPFGTYHFTGSPDVTWFGFAQSIFAEAAKLGKTAPLLEPITSDQYPTPAKRPAWSVLDNAKIARDWDIAAPDWRRVLPGSVESLLAHG